jgi:hypothetical protein
MILDYLERGENNPEFLAVCQDVAEARDSAQVAER